MEETPTKEVTGNYSDENTAEVNTAINADLVNTRGEGDEGADQ